MNRPRHLELAVSGHDAALRGDHRAALVRYREAMHVAVASGAPEVFFRHYLEATLESLELSGALDDVVAYCDRAVAHYAANPPAHDLATVDLATKRGDRAGAAAALERAVEVAGSVGVRLALAATVLGWLRRGLVVTRDRLLLEQKKARYFSVRPGTPRVGAHPEHGEVTRAGQ